MTTLIGYEPLRADALIGALASHAADPSAANAERLARVLVGVESGVPYAGAIAVLGTESPLARIARHGIGERHRRILARELGILADLAHQDLRTVLDVHGLGDYAPEESARPVPAPGLPVATAALARRMAETRDWSALADEVAVFHRGQGTGPLARHRSARVIDGVLQGIAYPDVVRESDLVGGGEVRARLASVLGAFVAGGPAVDVLLYGPPGTGKSTTVHALASAFADDGLRLVQIDRREIHALGDVLDALRGDGPRCLVVFDDLVFDDGERTDRELRAMLEGDASERPSNVAVWATSNRMRLIHETRSAREDDLEEHLGRGERSALASRFGLRIGFGFLTVAQFLDVARSFVHRRLGEVPDDVDAGARRFGVDRGLTPRAARQFADLYVDERAGRGSAGSGLS